MAGYVDPPSRKRHNSACSAALACSQLIYPNLHNHSHMSQHSVHRAVLSASATATAVQTRICRSHYRHRGPSAAHHACCKVQVSSAQLCYKKRDILLVTSLIVVVPSDTMINTDEQPHARYSPCKKLRGGNLLLLLIFGSVLDWMNDQHLNLLPIFGLARGCSTLVAV